MVPMVPRRITIHCSDSANGVRVPAETIRNWHLSRGFEDIGYHLVIQPDGSVENGRGLNVQGAHVEGDNEGNVGICLVGRDKFTKAQFVALRYKLDSIFLTHDIPKWEIYCHAQFESARRQGKNCPNMMPNHIMYWYITQDTRAIERYISKEWHP